MSLLCIWWCLNCRLAIIQRLSCNCWCYNCWNWRRLNRCYCWRYIARTNYSWCWCIFRFCFRLNHWISNKQKKNGVVNWTKYRKWYYLLILWISVIFGCVFLMWRSRFPFPINAFPHWLHPKGFSPVCDRLCETKWPFDIKSFGHKSQRNGRSALTPLLWLRLWNNKFPFRGNDLPHSSHSYGLSPVWHRLKFSKK